MQKFAVAFFVHFFDFAYGFKQVGQFGESFFFGFFGKRGIHVGPFIIFAVGGIEQVFGRSGDVVAVQRFEPQLGVFFFVVGGFFKNFRNLNKPFFFRFGSVVGVFVAGLRFAGKSGHQVFFGFRAFEFHLIISFYDCNPSGALLAAPFANSFKLHVYTLYFAPV